METLEKMPLMVNSCLSGNDGSKITHDKVQINH